jgi:hypothetical protein
MKQHTISDLIDNLAHLLYNIGWVSVIPIGITLLFVIVLVRVIKLIFRIPIFAWIFGYMIYRKTKSNQKWKL